MICVDSFPSFVSKLHETILGSFGSKFLGWFLGQCLGRFWADFILAYLFILNHDKVICDGSFPCNFIFKWQETKASTFFLLLIVHYDNFTDFTIVCKETAQICFCDGWWKTTQKYLKLKKIVDYFCLIVCFCGLVYHRVNQKKLSMKLSPRSMDSYNQILCRFQKSHCFTYLKWRWRNFLLTFLEST